MLHAKQTMNRKGCENRNRRIRNADADTAKYLFFEGVAVIENQGAIEKQHIRIGKINQISKHIGMNIPDIYKVDGLIAVREIGGNAAAERIAKEDELLVALGRGIFNVNQRF